jgi:FixJ family two-component response regulator
VSGKQFFDNGLEELVLRNIKENEINAELLELELTESSLMSNTEDAIVVLRNLNAIGIRISIDDFGTGYSSLAYLKRFPIGTIKIDIAFIRGITTNPEDAAIVVATITMAHNLKIRVVAEGVETEAQLTFLQRHGCDEIQGYYFSRPVPVDEIDLMRLQGKSLPAGMDDALSDRQTLLIVDDEVNILSSLKRLLRQDGYHILTAQSAAEGFDVLAMHPVQVILCDQRMPVMSGTEFLGKVKDLYPDTIRIVLSGYTELQSVTDAVNQSAIYKFLTKPWDDTQLRGHIEEAFRRKGMADENRRLDMEVRAANNELAAVNRQLEDVLQQQQQQMRRDEASLHIIREVLQHVPIPVIGLDDKDEIAFVNSAAQTLFKNSGAILGGDVRQLMPGVLQAMHDANGDGKCVAEWEVQLFQVMSHVMGNSSLSRGKFMSFTKYGRAP